MLVQKSECIVISTCCVKHHHILLCLYALSENEKTYAKFACVCLLCRRFLTIKMPYVWHCGQKVIISRNIGEDMNFGAQKKRGFERSPAKLKAKPHIQAIDARQWQCFKGLVCVDTVERSDIERNIFERQLYFSDNECTCMLPTPIRMLLFTHISKELANVVLEYLMFCNRHCGKSSPLSPD